MPRKTPRAASDLDLSGRTLTLTPSVAIAADMAEYAAFEEERTFLRVELGQAARALCILGINAWEKPDRYPQLSPREAAEQATRLPKNPYQAAEQTYSFRTSFAIEQKLEAFMRELAKQDLKEPDRATAVLKLIAMGISAWRYQRLHGAPPSAAPPRKSR